MANSIKIEDLVNKFAEAEKQMETRREWQDNWLVLIKDCQARESKLSDWERGFIQSIFEQINSGKTLSEKQEFRLEITWQKAVES